ncbi:hypothetical protein MC885_011533 [Smutsia gigantea]|nr:hypothetical protein MC885_011533 [Smutsia gigantea]
MEGPALHFGRENFEKEETRLNTFPQPRFILCGQTHPPRGPAGCAGSILAEDRRIGLGLTGTGDLEVAGCLCLGNLKCGIFLPFRTLRELLPAKPSAADTGVWGEVSGAPPTAESPHSGVLLRKHTQEPAFRNPSWPALTQLLPKPPATACRTEETPPPHSLSPAMGPAPICNPEPSEPGTPAFTETQKKRLLSWKQQVQKLFRSFPRKTLLDISGYRQQRKTAAEHRFLSTRTLGGKFQVTFLKQMRLGKGCREKAFPEGELNVIFYISVYIVKMTVSLAPNSLGCSLGWVGLDPLCTLRIPGCPDEKQALLQPPPLRAAPFPGLLSSCQAAIVLPNGPSSQRRSLPAREITSAPPALNFVFPTKDLNLVKRRKSGVKGRKDEVSRDLVSTECPSHHVYMSPFLVRESGTVSLAPKTWMWKDTSPESVAASSRGILFPGPSLPRKSRESGERNIF